MSNVNNQFKELINEAIHNHFHDKTELEMTLKDWLYGICEQADEYEAKAKAFDHIENLVRTELTSGDLYNDARNNDYIAGMLRGYEMVDYIIDDYESGEYDAKK